MLDSIKPLIDSNLISEETRSEISEAWEAKLQETREAVRTELREEFAERYDHDKKVMVEALDKMVTENLTKEISEFVEDKKHLAEERVAYKAHMSGHAKKFNQFMTRQLAVEVKELHGDRGIVAENFKKMENFIIKQLAKEINEFGADKNALAETKVRLVQTGREKLKELKAKFIKKSAVLVKETVTKTIKGEMRQLKEDIKIARENDFGRRLFESYAAEFTTSHLNENAEIKKLQRIINRKGQEIAEAKIREIKTRSVVESKNKQISSIKREQLRESTINELLSPLSKEKQRVMSELLEDVQTDRLRSSYDKYLPAVLNESGRKSHSDQPREKRVIAESRTEVTGNKKQARPVSEAKEVAQSSNDVNADILDLKKLSGQL